MSKNKSVICKCGGKYISRHKNVHFKTKKHRRYLGENIIGEYANGYTSTKLKIDKKFYENKKKLILFLSF